MLLLEEHTNILDMRDNDITGITSSNNSLSLRMQQRRGRLIMSEVMLLPLLLLVLPVLHPTILIVTQMPVLKDNILYSDFSSNEDEELSFSTPAGY